MAIENLHGFMENYFKSHHCSILESTSGKLSVQLTEDMDKVLMNRPFYWHYISKMGYKGEPAHMTFYTDKVCQEQNERGEYVDYGSPRFQQIVSHLTKNERYTKLFQALNVDTRTPLYPWLVVNLKITYTGKQRKEEMMSIGLNLINGIMTSGMMDTLSHIDMQLTIPDFCYTLSPMIKLGSGFKRIEDVISDYIQRQDHNWAQESLKSKTAELELLDHFYEGQKANEEQAELMEKERLEIEQRLSPTITMEVVNGGVMYLSDTLFASK
ncbi:uncharacterized protein JNUCC1_03538 [Lentibacillus sp. JNUCC-1]|uniref:YqhG family protein n=1 Tax=Lentibacillus sp. JNUCC-1 TaxID=2654513 RepID=UPI0012E80C4F|nr:YqhG family protein [Lentibacillus sp. JNUCC-1]MUV39654.1 uncharacterized protein [Lentibacillus sp. JNUCC-1]